VGGFEICSKEEEREGHYAFLKAHHQNVMSTLEAKTKL
jgi:hypothetical protein